MRIGGGRGALAATLPIILAIGWSTSVPSAARTVRPQAIVAEAVATGLNFPAAFTIAPDGRIFYGERLTGQIRIYDPSNGSNTLFYQVTHLVANHERGLLGLALDPAYPSTPYVYAYATRKLKDGRRNQILRLTDAGGTGSDATAIWTSNTTSATIHNGGRILFGPDGMLYAFQGAPRDTMSQDLSKEAGKVLRMEPDGGIPLGNPFPDSRIWSYGNRNSYGFTFDPVTGNLWETENGPNCNDEINLIVAGSNYGWGPTQTCKTPPPAPINTNQDGPDPVLPVEFFSHTLAVTGASFCSGCGLSDSEGSMFWGDFKGRRIHRDVLTADRLGIASSEVVYTHTGRILSIERGPDGALYFSDVDGGLGGIYRLVDA